MRQPRGAILDSYQVAPFILKEFGGHARRTPSERPEDGTIHSPDNTRGDIVVAPSLSGGFVSQGNVK